MSFHNAFWCSPILNAEYVVRPWARVTLVPKHACVIYSSRRGQDSEVVQKSQKDVKANKKDSFTFNFIVIIEFKYSAHLKSTEAQTAWRGFNKKDASWLIWHRLHDINCIMWNNSCFGGGKLKCEKWHSAVPLLMLLGWLIWVTSCNHRDATKLESWFWRDGFAVDAV